MRRSGNGNAKQISFSSNRVVKLLVYYLRTMFITWILFELSTQVLVAALGKQKFKSIKLLCAVRSIYLLYVQDGEVGELWGLNYNSVGAWNCPPTATTCSIHLAVHTARRVHDFMSVMLFSAINTRKLHQRNRWLRQCHLSEPIRRLRALFRAPATKETMPHACRAVSDVISSSMLAGARGGHAGGEIAIYTKLKWFKTNSCHYTQ